MKAGTALSALLGGLAVGATLLVGTGVPDARAAIPSLTSAPAITATAHPCTAIIAGGPCTLTPAWILATWRGPIVATLTLSWLPSAARPAAAPVPPQLSTALATSAPGACTNLVGQVTCSWPWPPELELASTVLNGTYQLAAPPDHPGDPAPLVPAIVAVSAPPASPAQVAVTADGTGAVTVSWSQNREADLAGYRVERNSVPVWSCALGALPRCPLPLAYSEAPGPGAWTYRVVADRYGFSSAPVDSAPAGPAPLVLGAVAPPTSPAARSGGTLQIPVAPVLPAPASQAGGGGSPTPHVALPTAPVDPGTSSAGATSPPAPTVPGFSPTLPYQVPSRVASPQTLPGADVAGSGGMVSTREPGPSGAAPGAMASVALGALVLALAAHLLYLRSRVSVERHLPSRYG
ncbi:MAG: hypothetical protein ACRDY0_04075 [Acidimicrobiales bacterium]